MRINGVAEIIGLILTSLISIMGSIVATIIVAYISPIGTWTVFLVLILTGILFAIQIYFIRLFSSNEQPQNEIDQNSNDETCQKRGSFLNLGRFRISWKYYLSSMSILIIGFILFIFCISLISDPFQCIAHIDYVESAGIKYSTLARSSMNIGEDFAVYGSQSTFFGYPTHCKYVSILISPVEGKNSERSGWTVVRRDISNSGPSTGASEWKIDLYYGDWQFVGRHFALHAEATNDFDQFETGTSYVRQFMRPMTNSDEIWLKVAQKSGGNHE